MLYGEQSLPKDPSVFPSGGWGGGSGMGALPIPPYQTYPTGLSTTYAINTNREAYIPHEPQNPHEGSSRSKIFEFSMRSRL